MDRVHRHCANHQVGRQRGAVNLSSIAASATASAHTPSSGNEQTPYSRLGPQLGGVAVYAPTSRRRTAWLHWCHEVGGMSAEPLVAVLRGL